MPDTTEKMPKPWCVTVYDCRGNVVQDSRGKDIVAGFDLASAADRFADRRLFDSEPGSYAIVNNTRMLRADDSPILSNTVTRDDAIPRVLKGRRPSVSRKGAPPSGLSFGCKVSQTRVTFSAG